ncbi:hypothetical protein XENORESO_013451 [Xenotaenia resolanae]|uniref:Uncharacterized protein n=1 Tax=Xenotaenia resolanae TaxID=208358 RepID=A0ABV0WAK5_9TELE
MWFGVSLPPSAQPGSKTTGSKKGNCKKNKLTLKEGFGTPENHSENHDLYMEKTWNTGEPSQEWLDYQNYSKSSPTTNPGGHRKTPKALQTSGKVRGHDSAIRKRDWAKMASMGTFQGQNHC